MWGGNVILKRSDHLNASSTSELSPSDTQLQHAIYSFRSEQGESRLTANLLMTFAFPSIANASHACHQKF
ncbi:hypothetical protein CW304_12810 [Bacillus sp. UFRGS-B20]|nr:hypothetical protein CW304_12810 [Bacillus sp. UFRGS-B20]